MKEQQIREILLNALSKTRGGHYFHYQTKGDLDKINEILLSLPESNSFSKIYFVTPKNAKSFEKVKMKENEIWIFDDHNDPHGVYMPRLFLRAIINAHVHGGMVFVTSNQPYTRMLESSLLDERLNPRFHRRAKELFGMISPFRIKTSDENSNTEYFPSYSHTETAISSLNKLLAKNKKQFTSAVQTELMWHFEGLSFGKAKNMKATSDNLKHLSPNQLELLIFDLKFFFTHPGIPIENICCRLDNFSSKTNGQEYFRTEAERVTDDENLYQKRGAYLTSPAGIGKTHIAIAVAKDLFHKGFNVIFVTPENAREFENVEMNPNDVWILDDLNDPNGVFMPHIFIKSIFHVHKHGGVVFVTSNQSYEEILRVSLLSYPFKDKKCQQIAKELFKTALSYDFTEILGNKDPKSNSKDRISTLTEEKLTEINRLITKLDTELTSRWKLNKKRKKVKLEALTSLKWKASSGKALSDCIDEIKDEYPGLTKGVSSRTRKLLKKM